MTSPELTLANVLLSALPILVLIVTIVGMNWSAPRAGAVAWLVVAAVALFFFGADSQVLAVGSSKGLSLALFVLLIIWTSVLLYNVIEQLGCIGVIGATMTRLVRDPLAQALVVGWAFSGFIQGIAGFGVPVAIVAPLLVMMGFHPAKAAAIVLVGHAWAVAFGALGSSYYTIQLVTGIDGQIIGPHMAAVLAFPIILTGFAVAHLQGGMASVRRGAPAILVMGASISVGSWLMAVIGAPQIASLMAGLIGCAVGWLVSRTPLLARPERPARVVGPAAGVPRENSGRKPGFHLAFLPFYLVLLFSILSQVPAVKSIGGDWQWGLDYPATQTDLGYVVEASDSYAPIRLLRHPAPLILVALALSSLVYMIAGIWRPGTAAAALRRTYVQCVPTSVGASAMMMMALLMTDTGMSALLGRTLAAGTGPVFPIISPFIGGLGTFISGSNTSSNVMFGALQTETARSLSIGTVTAASVQSIGGSLASAIAPAKVLVGTTIVGLSGREGEVMARAILYCLGILLMVGLEAWVLLYVFSAR